MIALIVLQVPISKTKIFFCKFSGRTNNIRYGHIVCICYRFEQSLDKRLVRVTSQNYVGKLR